jgi:selenium metabolism protein YedF
MKTLDCRDMACPEPVVRTKKALEEMEAGELAVLVNTTEANENVQRFARGQGLGVKASDKDGVFTIEIAKTKQSQEAEVKGDTVLVFAGDKFGTGDDDLGDVLIAAFINALPEAKPRPARMLFINRGVFLTTEGSRVLDTLKQLANEGVEVFSCGTCLNHYKLKEKLKVGQVTNMYDTVSSFLSAQKVVRI